MKTIATALLLIALAARAMTQPAPTGPAAAAKPAPAPAAELAALEQFLNLSDAELAQMEQVIARLRAMTPAARAALRAEITAFRQLPEPQRQQLRQGWGGMPPAIQDGWREMMQGATPERRTEIQARLQTLSPDEKMRYRRELVEDYLRKKASPAR